MLTAALILGGVSAIFELVLFFKLGLIRQLIERWLLLGLVFSFLLSIILGHIFGASGVTVMIAGVASTIATQPFYFAYNNRGRFKFFKDKKMVKCHT